MNDFGVWLSIISILLLPALGYYIKSENKINISVIKEWTLQSIKEVDMAFRKEIEVILNRIGKMELEQKAIENANNLMVERMDTIVQKIDSLEKRNNAIFDKVSEQHDALMRLEIKHDGN